MDRNIKYVVVSSDGSLLRQGTMPASMFPPAEIEAGARLVVPRDGVMPNSDMRFDLRKIRRHVNPVPSISDVLTSWRPASPTDAELFEMEKGRCLDELDRDYAGRIASISGPLAALHAEKRRQALAGGGPLVTDEADRQAILANAEAEEARIAEIEIERRRIKAALKVAATEAEIDAVMAQTQDRKSMA